MKRNYIILKLIAVFLLFSLLSCEKEKIVIDNPGGYDSDAPFVKLSSATTQILTDISFINKNEGMICGSFGFIAKTSNGGKSWELLNSGINHSFLNAFMLDSKTLYMARIGIYKSSNSGSSFSPLGVLADYSNSIFGICFFNQNEGVVIKGNLILKTRNGGSTWDVQYDSAENITKMQFTSKTVGYVAGGRSYDNSSRGEIHKTTDGGESWQQIHLTDSNISALYFINSERGFYTNYNDELFRTVDGGKIWRKISTVEAGALSLCFTGESIGYLSTYSGKILKTTNGGISWEVVYESANVPISKIIFVDKTMYAIGNNGLFLVKK
ncbi:MAG: hypothetical protein A2X17_06270 [Bacteroidetes bacterium GWF2_41_61]|nr:MAG: hypothetical protein A2X20_00430 [Bacteroidetes bacterium GWE2_40_15]OFY29866.1 MAG: hypothetical protein A2X17_06270 [Bacteroidetes bacterium GWF2_41_61]HBG24164.1 hypothetical protein [Rikenellaceae bacterium]HBZ26201.1 hypothetical protein [Rikenellaceae bacterium]